MSDFEERMRKKGYGEFFLRMLKGITLSCFVALPIYLFLTMLFANTFKDKADGGTDTVPMLLLQVAYLIAVYAFYIRHEAKEFYTPGKFTDAKTILRGYIRDGGWILPIVFGIVAAAAETMMLLRPDAVGNPVVFVGILNMPLMGAISVPILRAVAGYIVSVGGIFFMTVIARQKRKG
jgi:hypothetical protein